ncbi:hypothetical protein [Dietzia sp. 179-F 9C3 NHS]|uniref:hypothetical protein n=1 Tax=Dietzia sp. 179-F 9C3 NHS TaxID=3374295 RepID=UPI00387A2F74
MATPELVERIRHTADRLDRAAFLELLRWHRAVAGLPDLDWETQGAYRQAVAELGERRADELLSDLRRAARDPRHHRHGADGKPTFRDGRTLAERRRR